MPLKITAINLSSTETRPGARFAEPEREITLVVNNCQLDFIMLSAIQRATGLSAEATTLMATALIFGVSSLPTMDNPNDVDNLLMEIIKFRRSTTDKLVRANEPTAEPI